MKHMISDTKLLCSENAMDILLSIIFYSACSSTLLIINKLAVQAIGSTSVVLIAQFAASVLAVLVANVVSPKAVHLERFTIQKLIAFTGVVLLFCFCLYSNVKALEQNSVETVIVFRALSPIGVSFLDFKFLGRELPNRRTALALLAIAAGACLYAYSERTGQVSFAGPATLWLMTYFVAITSEMAFVKYIIESLPTSTWTRMFYNNLLSIPVITITGVFSGDFKNTSVMNLGDSYTLSILLAAGLVGVAISYAGFHLRSLISATSFTVVGVLCKLATLLISRLVWRGSFTSLGYCGLAVCILAGCFYEQAPKRTAKKTYDLEIHAQTGKLLIGSKTLKQH